MKKFNTLKTILSILVVLLISIVSFIGIFVKDKNKYSNVVKEYQLGMDLKGSRQIELNVNKEKTTEKSNSSEDTENSEKTEELINKEEDLTKENYIKSRKIIENRLKTMGVNDYEIRLNEENGQIVVNIPEDDLTDYIAGQLQYQGKFEVIDNETNEVLMTNDDIESVKAGYGQNSSSSQVVVFINFQFNKEGTEKFRDITNTYVETTEEVASDNENAEEAVETNEQETNNETKTKEIAIKIDDSTLLTTHFDTEITNGLLQLSVGSSNTSSTEELKESYISANNMAALIDNGKMPLVYQTDLNQFVASEITKSNIQTAIIFFICAVLVSMIYLMFKYKENHGIFAPMYLILHMAILLLLLRYTNVVITVSGLFGIVISYVLGYIALVNRLENYANSTDKKEAYKKSIKQTALLLAPAIVIAVVFAFNSWQSISSFGMVTFWGTLVSLLYMI